MRDHRSCRPRTPPEIEFPHFLNEYSGVALELGRIRFLCGMRWHRFVIRDYARQLLETILRDCSFSPESLQSASDEMGTLCQLLAINVGTALVLPEATLASAALLSAAPMRSAEEIKDAKSALTALRSHLRALPTSGKTNELIALSWAAESLLARADSDLAYVDLREALGALGPDRGPAYWTVLAMLSRVLELRQDENAAVIREAVAGRLADVLRDSLFR